MDLSENLSTSKGPMQTLTKKPMKLHARNAKVRLTDPETGKTRTMKALGAAARRIHRKQILAGTDPAFVLPRELRWQAGSGGGGYTRAPRRRSRSARRIRATSPHTSCITPRNSPAWRGLTCSSTSAACWRARWRSTAARRCRWCLTSPA